MRRPAVSGGALGLTMFVSELHDAELEVLARQWRGAAAMGSREPTA